MQTLYPQTARLFQPLQLSVYSQLGSGASRHTLKHDLLTFIEEQKKTSSVYLSLLAIFEEEDFFEDEYNAAIWRELVFLTDEEENSTGFPIDSEIDPLNPGYCFDLAGTDFYVRPLQSEKSESSIKLSHPTLVFNLVSQIEIQLRVKNPMLRQMASANYPLQ